MKTCRIELKVGLEIDAFVVDDARDLAVDAVLDLDGLGVKVIYVTVTDQYEQC